MNKSTRRFIFLDFSNLKRIKFKKLEKVCDRLFVFIRKEEEQVPFQLVQKMQRFGKNAKWVVIEGVEKNMNYHISFFMGKLHEKIDISIEFAVLSNDREFDPLINFINSYGQRSCIRVKGENRKEKQKEASSFTMKDEMKLEEELSNYKEIVSPKQVAPATLVSAGFDEMHDTAKESIVLPSANNYTLLKNDFDETPLIERTAEETVQRLIRSGNRPALVSTLKNYILLHNQELTIHGNIEKIISKLESTKEIKVADGEVSYNF